MASHPADVLRRHAVTVTGPPDGPVLLLAHGFGCDQHVWRRLAPAFTSTHRVVAFDHVGSGGSDPAAHDPVRHASLEGYAQDLLEVCDALDVRDVTLVGNSASAMVAVSVAVAEPDRFHRLVLLAPSPSYLDDGDYPGGSSRADVEELLASLEANLHAWAAAVAPVIMGVPGSPELAGELADSFCRLDPVVALAFARVAFLSDSRPLLPAVRTPALVVQCTDDALVAPAVGRYVHHHLAGSTLVQLAATGHCPHVSAPAETAAAIRSYLGDGVR